MESNTNVAGHKTNFSTSSDSSEDEDEARKIREALCEESIYRTSKTVDKINNRIFSQQQKGNEAKTRLLLTEETKKLGLKSKRLLDKNDNEDDNVLQTTPGFRTFVARQLSNMLDSVLLDIIKDDVWQVPQSTKVSNTGIRLFSDSKALCRLDDKSEADRQQQNLIKTTSERWKHRKHKLSTSSESSEDEKIKTCVFTVTDIKKENEYLAVIEPQTAPSENTKTAVNGNSARESDAINQTTCHNSVINDVCVAKKKKKKRKKKKHDATTNDIS